MKKLLIVLCVLWIVGICSAKSGYQMYNKDLKIIDNFGNDIAAITVDNTPLERLLALEGYHKIGIQYEPNDGNFTWYISIRGCNCSSEVRLSIHAHTLDEAVDKLIDEYSKINDCAN